VVLGVTFKQLAAIRDVQSLPTTVYRMLSRAPQVGAGHPKHIAHARTELRMCGPWVRMCAYTHVQARLEWALWACHTRCLYCSAACSIELLQCLGLVHLAYPLWLRLPVLLVRAAAALWRPHWYSCACAPEVWAWACWLGPALVRLRGGPVQASVGQLPRPGRAAPRPPTPFASHRGCAPL